MIAKTTIYEFSLEEVKKAIVKELGVDYDKTVIEAVTVEIGDERFGATTRKVTGVKVTVKT